MAWVDTHCHLHMSSEQPAALLARARDAGVDWVVCPGTDVAGTEAAMRIAADHPGEVLATAGVHPHDAARWPEQRERIESLAAEAAAVGECGLDYYRNLSPPEAQRLAFGEQLEMAIRLDKPVIVHCRDAFADIHDMLEQSGAGPRTVLHCWTGGPRWTKRMRELDVTF